MTVRHRRIPTDGVGFIQFSRKTNDSEQTSRIRIRVHLYYKRFISSRDAKIFGYDPRPVWARLWLKFFS